MKPTPIQQLLPAQVEETDERGVVWRTLPHKPDLRVSTFGEVEKLDHRKGDGMQGSRSGAWRERQQYLRDGMWWCTDKISSGWVHRLVAQAFFGELAWTRRVAFVNGDSKDAQVGNLCVVVNSHELEGQSFKRGPGSGRKKRKSKNPSPGVAARFSDEKAQKLINDWYALKYEDYDEAAKKLKLTRSIVAAVILGLRRPHLDRPAQRRRVILRTHSLKRVLKLINDWESGVFHSKYAAAKAYRWTEPMVSRILSGKFSDHLPAAKDPPGYTPWPGGGGHHGQ